MKRIIRREIEYSVSDHITTSDLTNVKLEPLAEMIENFRDFTRLSLTLRTVRNLLLQESLTRQTEAYRQFTNPKDNNTTG
jgi:hypothetical protein